jgi:hypothetical protein
MPYDGTILKILMIVGLILALWTIFEEGAS